MNLDEIIMTIEKERKSFRNLNFMPTGYEPNPYVMISNSMYLTIEYISCINFNLKKININQSH